MARAHFGAQHPTLITSGFLSPRQLPHTPPAPESARATPPRVSVANVRFWPIADVQKGYRHVRYQEKRSVICFLLFPKILQIDCHLP